MGLSLYTSVFLCLYWCDSAFMYVCVHVRLCLCLCLCLCLFVEGREDEEKGGWLQQLTVCCTESNDIWTLHHGVQLYKQGYTESCI